MERRILTLVAVSFLLFLSCGRKQDTLIETPVPARVAGQTDMLQFAADPIADVGVGVVGLGMRGSDAVERLTFVPGCHVAAVCDVETDRAVRSLSYLEEKGLPAKGYSGEEKSYEELCADPAVDLVYICTDWLHHFPVAMCAMEHGKHVAIEVPSAMTLEECWALVDKSEQTRRHCMILENCCYDFFELKMLALSQAGVFGEIIHAEGAYLHNLDEFWDAYWKNWRLDFNSKFRGDLYASHGLGPVCQVLNIHRGDRMKSLVAMDTDSFNGKKHMADRGLPSETFVDGDVTTTMIRTEKGKSILVEHNVMTPRPYSRMYQLTGTEGYASKYPVQQVLLRPSSAPEGVPDIDNLNAHRPMKPEQLDALVAKFPNPILNEELTTLAKEVGGHGGMDFIMDYRLMYCLNNGLPLDIDVYDLAEWSCIGALGRLSLEHGSAPVAFPDFTRGAWNKVDGFRYAFAK